MAPSGPGVVRRRCRRVLYWIPVVFISLLLGWSYYAYAIQLCIVSMENVGEQVVCLMAYHLLFAMFVWSYWKTIFTLPMNPSKEFHLSYAEKELLEREPRGEAHQEVLRRAAKDLPIYTRTMSGDPTPDQLLHPLLPKKRADLPVTSTEHCTTKYNKTRHTPLYQGWARQPRRRKMFPRAYKRVKDTPTPTVRSSPKPIAIIYICRGPITDPCKLCIAALVSVRPQEPCLVDYPAALTQGSQTLWLPQFVLPIFKGFPKF